MTFKHLEDTLKAEETLPYLEFIGELQEPTKTVLGYTLDIASHLHFHGLLDQYAIFGGYAVLSNLMRTFGDSVAKVWRGSTDIDMGGNYSVLNSIRSGYCISNDRPSPNIPNKRTLKLDTDGERKCKIDFYLGDFRRKYGHSRINTHFDISLSVVKPEFIIREKLKIPRGNDFQHYGDILAMLSVLEKEGNSPHEFLKIFDHSQIEDLRIRIRDAETEFSKDRFGFFPSKEFSASLRGELHKRRPVK